MSQGSPPHVSVIEFLSGRPTPAGTSLLPSAAVLCRAGGEYERPRNPPRERRTDLFRARRPQGEIILRTRARRIIFIAGLVGIVVLAIILRFAIG
ncbi:hypothetical protein FJ934_18255 [Mesorhizobium sp. B2-4-12]|nr:hypothetical protein FJ934_18255 [Mesorhizobium sp. B2-4-12]